MCVYSNKYSITRGRQVQGIWSNFFKGWNHAEFQHTYIYFINTVNSYKFRSQECPANQLLEDFFVQDERFFKPIMVERILGDAFQECVAYLLVIPSMLIICETGMIGTIYKTVVKL